MIKEFNENIMLHLDKSCGCPTPSCPCPHPVACPACGSQDVMVSVPIEIKPFAKVEKVKTECLGEAVITEGNACHGCEHFGKRHACKFTISQKMRVEVPVIFGARTEIGEACVNCDCPKECKAVHEQCHCAKENACFTF